MQSQSSTLDISLLLTAPFGCQFPTQTEDILFPPVCDSNLVPLTPSLTFETVSCHHRQFHLRRLLVRITHTLLPAFLQLRRSLLRCGEEVYQQFSRSKTFLHGHDLLEVATTDSDRSSLAVLSVFALSQWLFLLLSAMRFFFPSL